MADGMTTQAAPLPTTDAQFRAQLTPAQYDVMRAHGTERPGSSSLNTEKRQGIFYCAACALPLFASGAKFESGTGWPSFFEPLPNGIETRVDKTLFMRRVETHCRRCGSHLGHVFPDGPKPTGQRYCINGVALRFEPGAT